jgi:epoxyqueuosine reductase
MAIAERFRCNDERGTIHYEGSRLRFRSLTMKEEVPFIKRLERKGIRARIVSTKHVKELGAEIKSLREKGDFADEIYRIYGPQYFDPQLPSRFPDAESIIVVSTPQPMIQSTFNYDGRKLEFIVPPTYYDANKVTWAARKALKEAFAPKSYKLVRAALPIKLLAVRSGLARYGKTNITYVPEHGSFHRLTAFYSDYDSPVDYWQEKEALPLCSKCRACVNACPTSAIQKDRFLIRAHRCLTFLNEKASKIEFPEWLDRTSHNTLIGCMRCQRACPYNKDVAHWIVKRGTFSEEETAYLLEGKFNGEKAKRIERKLKRLGLDLSTFPRNLKVLVELDRA